MLSESLVRPRSQLEHLANTLVDRQEGDWGGGGGDHLPVDGGEGGLLKGDGPFNDHICYVVWKSCGLVKSAKARKA